ncbi:hypothetical protein B0T17DRAFT_504751 [Bombardia bombarda]|uniref:Uncharacterized protein n=1 Tax=Bombardia bombarda TaxID=252184 RepID=A0AA39XQ97_9PEZI|nr:hypothetical protein B0T17DRAFT_504751 [Bombardia bombarda]
MSSTKTYFLVPGWDFSTGSVPLGSIITNPTQPQLALFRPSPDDIDTPIHATDKAQFSTSGNSSTAGVNGNHAINGSSAGLFGTFLNLFGLGSEDSFHYDRTTVLSYSFHQLHSAWFVPSDVLKRKAVAETDRVAQFCRATEYKTPVYLVTGLKTIKGAGVTTSSAKGSGWRVSLNVGAAPADEVGEEPLPIVWALQLEELKLSESGQLSSGGFNNGLGDAELQEVLNRGFGEGTFTIVKGVDEEDGTHCRIVASSPACIDLLTAGSARIDPSLVRGQRRASVVYP